MQDYTHNATTYYMLVMWLEVFKTLHWYIYINNQRISVTGKGGIQNMFIEKSSKILKGLTPIASSNSNGYYSGLPLANLGYKLWLEMLPMSM